MKRERVDRVTIGVEHGCVRLRCPHCGSAEILPGETKGRTFMRRWNAFRQKHDWRCASDAQIKANADLALDVAMDGLAKAKALA